MSQMKQACDKRPVKENKKKKNEMIGINKVCFHWQSQHDQSSGVMMWEIAEQSLNMRT